MQRLSGSYLRRFSLTTYETIRILSRIRRCDDRKNQHSKADRRRARDPARAVGARAEQRARCARRAQHRAEHRLHDGAQAVTDHDRKGIGRARRVAAGAHLRGAIQRTADATSAPGRPDGACVRRFSGKARDAGTRFEANECRRARCDSGDSRPDGRREALSKELLGGPVPQAIGWSLLHLVWEAALVGGILAAVLALMSRRSANARYLVACAALACLPFLVVITALRSYEAPIHVSPSPAIESAAPSGTATSMIATSINYFVASSDATTTTFETLASTARGWLPQIVLVWLAGVTFFSIRLVVSWTRVQKLARAGAQPAGASWQRIASRLSGALALKRAIALVESASVEVPTVIGWLRPIILLPASTPSGLTPEQIEMVLAHKLAHIRRHDFFVNLMQTVVETLMFYHPAVWWISGRIRDEREHCCDDLAIAVCGNPLQYARALTRLEELQRI